MASRHLRSQFYFGSRLVKFASVLIIDGNSGIFLSFNKDDTIPKNIKSQLLIDSKKLKIEEKVNLERRAANKKEERYISRI